MIIILLLYGERLYENETNTEPKDGVMLRPDGIKSLDPTVPAARKFQLLETKHSLFFFCLNWFKFDSYLLHERSANKSILKKLL